ncbi:ATP-binding protein [Photobacterium atrarenae]|uniref:histidine kinase n=1 Tax=Photobacterium atrarenae TaxID=865757 RepID=A0ABY5GGX5_9GAMM|nr:ATP-binding protein [Photobacterium atrarenae]UTV28520.1 ATP-binding protein [Photobacterium atrarenae]
MVNILAVLWLLLSVLWQSSVALAETNTEHVFYPLPYQESGSFVTPVKMFNNPAGGVWILDARGELLFYDGRKLNHATDTTGQPIAGVQDAVMIAQTLWLVKDGAGYAYSPATLKLRHLPLTQTNLLFVESQDQTAWFADAEGLYAFRHPGTQPAFYPFPKIGTITGLYGTAKSLFIAGEKGAYEFTERQFSDTLLYPEQRVTAVFLDSQQQLWFGTQRGLYQSRSSNAEQSRQQIRLDRQPISAISETRAGLWVGTLDGLRLLNLQGRELNHFRALSRDLMSLHGNHITALLASSHNGLWVGTNQGLNFSSSKAEVFKIRPYGVGPHALPASQINDMVELADGTIWLASDNGLIVLNERLEERRHLPQLGAIQHMAYRDGTMWLAAGSELLAYSVATHTWSSMPLPSNVQPGGITNLMVDHFNSVWIGKQSHLYRYWTDTGEVNAFGNHWIQAPYGSELITTLFEDQHKQVWVGTDYALYQFDAGRLQVVAQTKAQGGVIELFEDKLARLWVLNNQSLQYVKSRQPFSLQAAQFNGQHARLYCMTGGTGGNWIVSSQGIISVAYTGALLQHLTPPVGLNSTEFYIPTCQRLRSGALLIGGRNGLMKVEPGKLLDAGRKLISVIMSEVYIDHQLVRLGGAVEPALEIPKGASLSIQVGVLPFSGMRQLQYRLLGNEASAWQAFHEPMLHFENMAVGHYQLQIRLAGTGASTAVMAQMPIQVRPPWYISPLMASLGVGGALLLILGLTLWRVWVKQQEQLAVQQAVFRNTAKNALEKKHLYASNLHLKQVLQMRRNFMAQLHQELTTPLTLILDNMSQLQASQSPEGVQSLKVATQRVEHSMHLIEELLKHDSKVLVAPERACVQLVAPVVKACCMSWQGEAERKEIVLSLEDEAWGASVKVAPYHLDIMLGNLLSNALKYTPRQGTVSVVVKTRGQHLLLSVSDTGSGMSKTLKEQVFDSERQVTGSGHQTTAEDDAGFGLGLCTVKQLAESYGGEVSVVSYEGVGSEFMFSLPLYRQTSDSQDPDRQEMRPAQTAFPMAGVKESALQILIVSSEPEIVACLTALLEAYHCLVAHDGYEALILAKDHHPQLVICDQDLPGLYGSVVWHRLSQEIPELDSQFMLLVDRAELSSYEYLTHQRPANSRYCEVEKPLDPVAILRKVEQLLPSELLY